MVGWNCDNARHCMCLVDDSRLNEAAIGSEYQDKLRELGLVRSAAGHLVLACHSPFDTDSVLLQVDAEGTS